MRGKIFTRAEADQMVPLIRRIVVHVRARRRLVVRKRRLVRDPGHAGPSRAQLADVVSRLEDELATLRHELEGLGCILRDGDRGIVECYGELDSEIVYFSWRPGQPGFGHWHALDTSHTKAKPLPAREQSTAVE